MTKRLRGFEIVHKNHKRNYNANIHLPTRADSGSAGYDIYSPISAIIKPNEQLLIWTDIKAYMQKDEILEINTRSGNGVKRGIILSNIIGWIDSSYYENESNDGNIGICLKNTRDKNFIITEGDRIAQAKFSKYLTTDNDSFLNNNRRGGFGSSDNGF